MMRRARKRFLCQMRHKCCSELDVLVFALCSLQRTGNFNAIRKELETHKRQTCIILVRHRVSFRMAVGPYCHHKVLSAEFIKVTPVDDDVSGANQASGARKRRLSGPNCCIKLARQRPVSFQAIKGSFLAFRSGGARSSRHVKTGSACPLIHKSSGYRQDCANRRRFGGC